jgi:biotin operon repressor
MKETTHFTGHRWTEEEIKTLIKKWEEGYSIDEIGVLLNSTRVAILKQVQLLRKNGIPLKRRKSGNPGNKHAQWTQGDVEYLLRRRNEKATSEEIGIELGRTPNAVDAMIGKLRKQSVNIAMRGQGVKRLYNIEALKAVTLNSFLQQ